MVLDDDEQCHGGLDGDEEPGAVPRTVIQAKMGKLAAPIMDASETYRVKAKITANSEMAASAAPGAATRKTPKPVATPLPPLKRSQMGNMWPSTAHKAARACALTRRTQGSRSGGQQSAQQDGGAAFEHVE